MFDAKLRTRALTAAMLLVPILVTACSDDASLTREEVRGIVRSEVAASAPETPGPTGTGGMAEPDQSADTGPGPAAGMTRAEVEQLIQAAVADLPQPDPGPDPAAGMTRAEVEQLIQAAVADLPQPDPGLTAEEARRVAQYAAAAIPPKTLPAEYTRFFVQSAIGRYETLGLDATLAHYNREESVDGQWYVFIVDQDDLVLAHPDGSLAGLDLKGPLGTDANGYNFGREMLSADEEGRWVSYVYENPETRDIGSNFGELQLKNAWVVRHDGLLFGSGWYVDADEFTRSFVAAAVAKFREAGLEGTVEYFTGSESEFAGLAAAIDYYNSAETVQGEWSAFLADGSGRIVDHYDKSKVGRDLEDLFGTDMLEATAEGNWVTTESLRIWVVGYEGMVFGSGWHRDESGG